MNNDETPTTPIGGAPEPTPGAEPAPQTAAAPRRSIARPLLIGAAAGVGVLLVGGIAGAATGAFGGPGLFQTVPAAVSSTQAPTTDATEPTATADDDRDAAEEREREEAERRAMIESGGDATALVDAIDRAVAAADGTGASSVEVESDGWKVDVILADGSEVDVRVGADGATTVRADHRDDDADPALDTARIAEIAAAAITAAGGTGSVTSIETDRDDSHAFSVSVFTGATDDVDVDLTETLEVVEID
ncbi:hypothetical protein [Microbacterium sp. bgisy189]|uniref:hypothetical protein n=1 Tax=Microbacterium sp. bgisy189 TaxID=3413798 RepID=UPI003EB8752E